jgi:hypothetical protein
MPDLMILHVPGSAAAIRVMGVIVVTAAATLMIRRGVARRGKAGDQRRRQHQPYPTF